MEVVLFVGLQASGKSTFYRTHFAESHTLISKDLLRNNKRPQRRQMRLLREALERGEDVVVDNTNPAPEDRAPLIEMAREFQASIVGYYFQSTLEGSKQRNALREGRAKVPDVALYSTIKKLTPPTPEEGFDALYTVELKGVENMEIVATPVSNDKEDPST